MKNSICYILLLLSLGACNFTDSEPITTNGGVPINTNKTKQDNKPNTTNINATKKDSIVSGTIGELTSNSTLSNDSAFKEETKALNSDKAEIERLKLKIQTLMTQSNTASLKKSTYKVKYPQSVEGYLYEMYVKELETLKKINKTESMLSENYKKFYTIPYCDNRVLEWLDEFAAKSIRYNARRMTLRYDKVSNASLTGSQIITHK